MKRGGDSLFSLEERPNIITKRESSPVNLNSFPLFLSSTKRKRFAPVRKKRDQIEIKKEDLYKIKRGSSQTSPLNSLFVKTSKEKGLFSFNTNPSLSQRGGGVAREVLNLLKSSSHFGRKSRDLDFTFPWHPSMCSKFSGIRNQIPHISGEQTLQCLVEAFYCIALVLRKGGKILVVNKNHEFSALFHTKSFNATAPLSWVGGCLTNWKEISKSVATFLYFSKEFGQFIKQNNIHFPRFKKMRNSFQGFINVEKEQLLLKEKPQLLFLFNAYESQQILHEAIALQIPVVALTDSSTDLSQITYPIPINPDSINLVHSCLSQLMRITDRQKGFLKSK